MFIFGTRPEAIKMAPLIRKFKGDAENFLTKVTVTGQHRQMLDQVLRLFRIDPDYDLKIMTKNQSLEELTSRLLKGISSILRDENPDLIVVQGDTTTTFVGALAAFYKKIPVAHVEAGLRTNDIYSPFPEEVNRRITSSIATFHFPPTEKSRKNLLDEGIDSNKILVSGNTVIDALKIAVNQVEKENQSYEAYFRDNYDLNFDKKTLLVTGHRRESFGDKFENICLAIKEIALKNDIKIVYPVHLNPNVQEPVKRILNGVKNVHLIPPQDYAPFVYLMKKSYLVLSDSGGVQEEAPSIGKPVVVMRENTERPEGIEAGTTKLVGTDTDEITKSIELLINNKSEYNKMAKSLNPYGDGKASNKIYDYIVEKFIN